MKLEDLKKRGWTESEIKDTLDILAKGKRATTFFDKFVYWSGLLLAILGNLIVSVVLIPFLLAMQGIYLYLTLAIIGLSFGALFEFLLTSLERIMKKEYVIASIFIPAIAIINIYVMAILSNKLALMLRMSETFHSPLLISLAYVGSFMMPYAVRKVWYPEEGKSIMAAA